VLGWIDGDLIKAGELAALTALELALKARYGAGLMRASTKRQAGQAAYGKRPSFRRLLECMIELEGLSDEVLPLAEYRGAPIVAT